MGKRTNGEGSIRRRKDGRWEARITIGRDSDGKLIARSFYGNTQKEVKEQLAKFRKKKEEGLNTEHDYTFEEYGQKWYRDHGRNITVATQENYKYIFTRLCNMIGNKKLNSFKPDDIADALDTLKQEGVSKSYLAKARAVMNQIFRKATGNGYIVRNPVSDTEKQKMPAENSKKDAFHADEIKKMMEQLSHDLWGDGIRLMLGTGMREQELLGLEPDHITEDGSMITVEQASVWEKGGAVIGPTKTECSNRKIPVPACLQECARKMRNSRETGLIYEGDNKGRPYAASTFRKHYYTEISRIEGVRRLSPHCCRHTYVSQLQAVKVNGATIKDLLGHSDIEMTLHYLHVQPEVFEDAAEKLNKLLIGEEEKNLKK